MVVMPDLMTLANGGGDDAQIRDLQGKMIAHCENMGDRIAILDAPPNLIPQDILEWRMNTAGYDSKFATLYYPWIEVVDPLTNPPMMVPPSGHMAGIWARTDSTRGVHKAPANEVVLGANGLGFQITQAEQGALNQVGINCIRSFPGRGIRVWGARTLSSDPEWRYLNVRRLFNYVSESIMQGTQWAVFEPNDQRLWTQLRIAASNFLTRTWRQGALFGSKPVAGVLRQVRRGDEPARRRRGRPGRGRDRDRAGEARRVRDLPDQPVRRRRRGRGVERTTSRAKGETSVSEFMPTPRHGFRLQLGGKESASYFRAVSGLGASTSSTDPQSTTRGSQPTRGVSADPDMQDIVLTRGIDTDQTCGSGASNGDRRASKGRASTHDRAGQLGLDTIATLELRQGLSHQLRLRRSRRRHGGRRRRDDRHQAPRAREGVAAEGVMTDANRGLLHLPKGYVDTEGTLHREGTMRLATARDEIEPLREARSGRTRRTSRSCCSRAW